MLRVIPGLTVQRQDKHATMAEWQNKSKEIVTKRKGAGAPDELKALEHTNQTMTKNQSNVVTSVRANQHEHGHPEATNNHDTVTQRRPPTQLHYNSTSLSAHEIDWCCLRVARATLPKEFNRIRQKVNAL